MTGRAVLAGLAALPLMTACATAGPGNTVWQARLTDAGDAALRQDIRRYVRDLIGPDYIADIDMLERGFAMTARDRGASSVRPGAQNRLPAMDRDFVLELRDTPQGRVCQLRPAWSDASDAPVLIVNGPCERIGA